MRIAILSLHWPRTLASGVGRKFQRQITAWRELGHEVQFFSHLHLPVDNAPMVVGEYFPYTLKNGPLGLLPSEFSRMRALKDLIAAVREYHPDVIYLRWSMYVYPLQRLFAIAPVVLEINTNDVEEHRLLGLVRSSYNRLTRAITLGGASGIVYATRELSELDVFQSFPKPGVVVSNSIDVDSVPFMPAPGNEHPHLVFIGTPGFAWHGVEKLIPLAQTFPDIVIDVIGYDRIESADVIPDNLILHGYQVGEACDRILARADAAIGTLALHRAGLNEASPLKVRDCVSRGIPIILPFIDTDLDSLQSDLILKIPNDEDNVLSHSTQIHDFLYRMRGKRIPREAVLGRIDSRAKEQQRLDFLASIVQS